jgi:hypothetical protein
VIPTRDQDDCFNSDGEIIREYQLRSVSAAFSSRRFYQYFFMLYFANIFTGTFSYFYRPIGDANHMSDNLLSWAGSSSALVQCFTRLIVGSLYDLCGFKSIFYSLMTLATILAFTVYKARINPPVYFLLIQLNYLVIGGVFALFPTPVYNTFGSEKAPAIYSIILLGAFFSTVTSNLMIDFLYEKIEAENTFIVGGVFALWAMVILCGFDERLDVEQLDRKEHIEWGMLLDEQRDIRQSTLNGEKARQHAKDRLK